MTLLRTGFREFAEPEEPALSTGRPSQVAAAQRLLVLADASLPASEILSWLAELARSRALEVVLIRVLPPGPGTSGTAASHARGSRDGGSSDLAPVIAALSRAGARAWSISCWGQPAAKIAEAARALGADVVVRRVPGAQGQSPARAEM